MQGAVTQQDFEKAQGLLLLRSPAGSKLAQSNLRKTKRGRYDKPGQMAIGVSRHLSHIVHMDLVGEALCGCNEKHTPAVCVCDKR